MENHPTKKELELFLRDLLPGEAALEILLHLEDCNICRDALPNDDVYKVIENLLLEDKKNIAAGRLENK